VPLTAQDVAEITRLLEESDFVELRLEHEGFKLTLKRATAGSGQVGASATPAAAASAPWPPASPAHTPAPAARPAAQSESRDPSLQEVTAPLLGIFYRAPRPGAAPYVEIGCEVQEDSVIGIIEVMKLMNSVRAEVRGTVVEILVEDGATVEYGQILLLVSRGRQSG